MNNLVETFSLTKEFPRQTTWRTLLGRRPGDIITAVDHVDLVIHEGEILGLLGPNGAGKSSLIRMLCTLLAPTSGYALVCGKHIIHDAELVKRSVGFVDSQERSFFWRLSGRENLRFFASLHGLTGRAQEERIAEVLTLVGLDEHADRRFMTYSSGMRQRLGIARGMLTLPRVLLMDEATRGLDPVSARQLRTFVRETLVNERRCTVIWVTHQLSEAEQICDRIAIMNRGRIIADGPVPDIKALVRASSRYRFQVSGVEDGALERIAKIAGVLEFQATRQEDQTVELDLLLADEKLALPLILQALVEQGARIQHCTAENLSLEEAFDHLLRGDSHGV